MGVENKAAGKKKWLLIGIILAVIAVAAASCGILLLGGEGTDEPTVPTNEPAIEGNEDDWLREALAEDSVRTIELNEDIKAVEGYEVNGEKTLVGTGKISMQESGNFVLSVNDGASLTVDGITLNVKNIGNNGVVVRAGGKLEWRSGTISYPKQYAIINYGQTTISGGTFEYAGANWLYLKSGTSAEVTGGYFVKSGSAGFEVEKDATLTISGEETLMERAGTNTINNNGTVIMTGGTISQSEVWTITNHGALSMDGVTVKDCSLKGVLYNYEDAVSAEISNCNFSNSKTYHVYNQKEVTIRDTVMDKSGSSSLNNQPNATMTLENISLSNCGYHGIYNDRGTITIKNCSIDTTVYKGVQNKTGYVTIDGLTLNNVGGSGLGNVAVVAGAGYGYIHANNVIASNTADYNVVSYGGEVILTNSTYNKTPGTNIYIRNGTATIENVKILGTTTPGKAALALGSDSYRTVVTTIKGSTEITGAASRGVTNYGTLYLYNVSIHGNATSGTQKSGGGIYTLGKVYMYGGSVSGNYAVNYGGGIRVDEDNKSVGALYMYGGYVGYNSCGANGGGISVADSNCGLYLYGGTVANNSAGKKGDGLLINGKFELYQDAVIKDNDIYLWDETRYIDVKTPGLNAESLTIRHGALSEGVLIAKFPSETDANDLSSRFVGANNQFDFVTSGAELVATTAYNDLVSPADFSNAQTVTVTTFQQLKNAVESTSGEKIIVIGADIPMTGIINVPASASVKLIDDGTARTLTRSGYTGELFWLDREANLYLAGSAGLTLDGDSRNGTVAQKPLIFATTEGYVVLQSGATLQNNTNISYETSACGGAVNVYGGRMIVEGGVITNCNAPAYESPDSTTVTNRPAIYVSSSAVLSVKGGEISGNLNGAIHSYGRVYISGGSISGNVRNGGGGAAIRAPWIYMTGGTITGNKSTNAGAAIYLTPSEAIPNGYFYMNGGTITGNTAGVNDSDSGYVFDTVGGAVYVNQNCTFECVAGTISDNQAIGNKTGSSIGMNGGGIVNDGTVILGSGVVMRNNYATRNAGAIYCRNKGAALIIEGTVLSGNYTDGRGGAIFSEGADNVITITGAAFENNKALGGGAMLISSGVHSVTDTVFTGNVAQRLATSYGNAGAIMNQGGSEMTLTNVTFDGNKAIAKDDGGGCGGAIYNDKGTLILNGVTAKNNEARVADDIFFSKNTVANTVNGAFDVTGIYLEGDETVNVGENFSGRTDGGLILVDLPTGSSTNRYVAGEQILSGNVSAEVAALFTLGESYPTMRIDPEGKIAQEGAEPDPEPTVPVARIGETEYTSLTDAVAAANEGDTIVIISDIVLTDTVTIEKAITITTDGQRDYTITGTPSSNNYYINIKAENVVVGGTGENSRLIIDGLGASNPRALVGIQGANSKLQYMVLQNNVNSSDTEGGAVYTNKTGIEINNCVLQNNKSCGGGAIYVTSDGSVTFNDCQLLKNESTKYGGAIQGAASSSGVAAVVTLNSCVVDGNSASNVGGAAYMSQSSSKYPATLIANNTTFSNNSTEKNGGVIRATGAFQLTGCSFTGNSGADGDISEGNGTAYTRTLTDCVFDKTEEDAIAKYSPTQIVITNCTFSAVPEPEPEPDPEPAGAVVKIGETGYATLSEAVAAASEGDTVVIVSDVVLTDTVTIEKAITVTTDGKASYTITGTPGSDNYYINIKAENVVVGGTGESSRLIIDGLNASNPRALVAIQGAGSELRYVTLQNNVNADTSNFGGAIYVNKAGVVVSNCIIQNNKSGGGGAVYLTGSASITLNNCQVLKNQSTKYGGAFQGASGSTLTLNGCTVDGNTASDVGGAGYFAQSSGKPATIIASNTAFSNNSTVKNGGVIRATGAFQLTGCSFTGNSGADGDISEGNGTAYTRTLTDCVFDKTEEDAIAKHASTQIVITNCTFSAVPEPEPEPEPAGAVAKIGETGYATLAEAVAAASEGDTVVIVSDIVLTDTVTIEKAITVTTDGKASYTITGTPGSDNYYINIKAGNVVVGGTGASSRLIIDGLSASNPRALVAIQGAGSELRYVTLQNNVNADADNLGGAIYVNKSGVVVSNCIIQNNKSGGGGAVYLTGSASVTLNNCQVLKNQSTKYGGAFQGAGGSTLTLNGGTVDGNTASNVGGAGYFAQSSGKPATIIASNTAFSNNSTVKNGGVIRATGAFQLTGCSFTGNSGADGDISEGNGTAYTRTLTDCVFDKTEEDAIAKHASTQIVITNCTFAEAAAAAELDAVLPEEPEVPAAPEGEEQTDSVSSET